MLNRLRFRSTVIFVGMLGILGVSIAFASEPPPAGEAVGSVSVRMYQVEGSLPANDPSSSQWDSVPQSEFKLAPQVHWPERIQRHKRCRIT